MNINNKIFSSTAEFEYNLNLFEKTLASGKVLDESFNGFIEIFKDQLAHCCFDGKKQESSESLRKRVTQTEVKFLAISKKEIGEKLATSSKKSSSTFPNPTVPKKSSPTTERDFFSPHTRSLMGSEIALDELKKGFNSGDIKIGLGLLEKEYSYRPIRGDGHCMFRSIAAGILFYLKSLSEEERKKKIFQIEGSLKAMEIRDLGFFLQQLDQLKQCSVDEIVTNKGISNRIAQILRNIAIKYEKTHEESNDVIESEMLANGNKQDYYKKMSEDAFGGEPELLALATSLGFHFTILNPATLAQNTSLENDSNHFGSKENPTIFLLFRGAHYDLAIKKGE